MVTGGSKQSRAAWLVIGATLCAGSAIALFVVLPNLSSTAAEVDRSMRELERRGVALTPQGCVKEAIAWHDRCADGYAPALCLQEVPIATAHCLSATDRAAACRAHRATIGAERSRERRGAAPSKSSTRASARDAAWRALDQFCLSGERGVLWGVK